MSPRNKKYKHIFSEEDEANLIKFVKSNELIYNVQHPKYRNSSMKQRLWSQFAQTIEKDVEVCLKKWSNIRDFYKKNQNRMGAGCSAKIKTRLENLSFLRNVVVVVKEKPFLYNNPGKKKTPISLDENVCDIRFEDIPATTQIKEEDLFVTSRPSSSASYTNIFNENLNLVSNSELTTGSDLQKIASTSSGRSQPQRFSNALETVAERDLSEPNELLKFLIMQRESTKKPVLNPLQHLFMCFAKTVETFPKSDQIDMKQIIFNTIMEREKKLLLHQRQER